LPTHIAATFNALRLFEIARVLVRFDHIASFIVNTMVSTRLRSRKRKTERELLARAPYELILYL